ncbi:PaaI family thioesterase [Massilia sp. TS11]|uniref:PaaI family thioesterase n=1 Tax=Massilia sp. TS11 TaxID=2908003 RepID=UPI001EDA9089|nr:PaaI family thioesterase [Massilia sp. TS11]MCG2585184.1 PaaI family thioesterase [Massilia sp. TS11]
MHTDPDSLNAMGAPFLPGHLGIHITGLVDQTVRAQMPVSVHLLAPNGYLHAGSVITLADTACGYGCMATLPEGATSFTTVELKSNHLGTARDGVVEVVASPVHLGRTTQVWDAVVSHKGKTIALFRCTQMLLYPKAKEAA